MPEIKMTEECDGRWTVIVDGLIVTDLNRDLAEAFVAACRKVQEREQIEATGATPAPTPDRGA